MGRKRSREPARPRPGRARTGRPTRPPRCCDRRPAGASQPHTCFVATQRAGHCWSGAARRPRRAAGATWPRSWPGTAGFGEEVTEPSTGLHQRPPRPLLRHLWAARPWLAASRELIWRARPSAATLRRHLVCLPAATTSAGSGRRRRAGGRPHRKGVIDLDHYRGAAPTRRLSSCRVVRRPGAARHRRPRAGGPEG